jgi:glutathione S-transferase
MNRILYSGTKNASSWAFRAWLALREANVSFEERVVDIRRPQRLANLNAISNFSPPGAVPVLVDEGTVIFDSFAIMEYANELSGGNLLPQNFRVRAHARSLVSWQHSGLSGICERLSFESSFYPNRRSMSETEVLEAASIYRVWEAELEENGGPYLMGELSLADLAFVPTVLRIVTHTSDIEKWPLTEAWVKLLLSRPSVREWLDEARTLPPVYLADYGSCGG